MVSCFRHFQKVLSLRSYKQLKWPEPYSFVHNGRLKTCFRALIIMFYMVNIHMYVAKYKIDNSRFWNIFPDFVPPPSFMVGGGYFGVCRTAEYDGCCKPNSWMQLNSLWMLSGPQNSFPLSTNFKTPTHSQPPPYNQTEPSHYNPPPRLNKIKQNIYNHLKQQITNKNVRKQAEKHEHDEPTFNCGSNLKTIGTSSIIPSASVQQYMWIATAFNYV